MRAYKFDDHYQVVRMTRNVPLCKALSHHVRAPLDPQCIHCGAKLPENQMDKQGQEVTQNVIRDYHKISCGCCTGRTIEIGVNYRIADDQCICWIHQDCPLGRPAKKCSHHAEGRA